ncbi:hypothetical protein N7512_002699 [Penicillium capsulatum]|nr:hypothetical protein N7512_002699 [Penicillium capsulatum]
MASSIASRLTSAQVHIQTLPPLHGLGQSKQILAALQKFGEVHTFRNLQYDVTNDSPRENRSIVAIFDSPDAAQRAIASSPITVTLAPTALPTTKAELATGSPSENGEEKTVQFTIEPSRHNHAASLKRNPFYSTYNLFKSNPIFDDMMQRDTGVPLKALADVLQSKKYYITAGVRNKVQEENRRLGAYSLMELWEEGKEWEMEKKSLSGYEVDGETKQGQDTEDVK